MAETPDSQTKGIICNYDSDAQAYKNHEGAHETSELEGRAKEGGKQPEFGKKMGYKGRKGLIKY